MTKVLYAGSFDPIHLGHIDIIKRSARAFSQVIVAIGCNPDKNYAFTLDKRLEMARGSLSQFSNVLVTSFKGLLVDYAYEQGISVIVKGIRNAEDFNYEQMLHQVGESQRLDIDTCSMFAEPKLAHISSKAVKALQREHGIVYEYVTLHVKQVLEEELSGQFIVGITGEIGAGKSYVAGEFEKEIGQLRGSQGQSQIPVHNIELDHIGHQILTILQEPKYQEVRDQIAQEFGSQVRHDDGFINKNVLGEIVFSDISKLQRLNHIMLKPLLVRLRRELSGKRGVILLNAALIAESDLSCWCNNNVVLVQADQETRDARLHRRGLTKEQICRRNASQYTAELKQSKLQDAIKRDRHGTLWVVENSATQCLDVKNTFRQIVEHLGL